MKVLMLFVFLLAIASCKENLSTATPVETPIIEDPTSPEDPGVNPTLPPDKPIIAAPITKFAQEVTSVDVTTTASPVGSSIVNLDFTYDDYENLNEDGSPKKVQIFGLVGSLIKNESTNSYNANLVLNGDNNYLGRIECLSATCLDANIKLTKFSGKIAGDAYLVYKKTNVNKFGFTYGVASLTGSRQAELAAEIRNYKDQGVTNLTAEYTAINVTDGGMYFSAITKFEKIGNANDVKPYVKFNYFGKVANNTRIDISKQYGTSNCNMCTISMVEGQKHSSNVSFTAENGLAISFLKDEGMRLITFPNF